MNTYILIPCISSSALEWSASRSNRFTSRKEPKMIYIHKNIKYEGNSLKRRFTFRIDAAWAIYPLNGNTLSLNVADRCYGSFIFELLGDWQISENFVVVHLALYWQKPKCLHMASTLTEACGEAYSVHRHHVGEEESLD
jgi:hypothetical protein